MAVHSVVLALVAPVTSVLHYEVAPVGAVFAVVPVVVVAVIAIVDADLDVSFLRLGAGDDGDWRGQSSTQEQQTEVSIDVTQGVSSVPEILGFRIPVEWTMRFWPGDVCPVRHIGTLHVCTLNVAEDVGRARSMRRGGFCGGGGGFGGAGQDVGLDGADLGGL